MNPSRALLLFVVGFATGLGCSNRGSGDQGDAQGSPDAESEGASYVPPDGSKADATMSPPPEDAGTDSSLDGATLESATPLDATASDAALEGGTSSDAVVDGAADGPADGPTEGASLDGAPLVDSGSNACNPPCASDHACVDGVCLCGEPGVACCGGTTCRSGLSCSNGTCGCTSALSDAGLTSATVLAADPSGDGWAVAVDTTYVYWVSGHYIKNVSKSGTVASDGGTALNPMQFIYWTPVDLVVDGTNVYWATLTTDTTAMQVQTMPAAGGTWSTLFGYPSNGSLNHSPPSAIAADVANVYVTTTQWGNVGQTSTVLKAPIGAADQDAGDAGVTTLALGEAGSSYAGAIVLDSAYAYYGEFVYATTIGSVKRVALGGGTPTVLASNIASQPGALAVDATNLYWGDGSRVMNVGISGGVPNIVALSPNAVAAIVVDATNVYWVDSTASVYSAPLAGGCPTLLVARSGSGNQFGMAIDATSIYWTDSSAKQVLKVHKDGSLMDGGI